VCREKESCVNSVVAGTAHRSLAAVTKAFYPRKPELEFTEWMSLGQGVIR
jgi:hypothetical protein